MSLLLVINYFSVDFPMETIRGFDPSHEGNTHNMTYHICDIVHIHFCSYKLGNCFYIHNYNVLIIVPKICRLRSIEFIALFYPPLMIFYFLLFHKNLVSLLSSLLVVPIFSRLFARIHGHKRLLGHNHFAEGGLLWRFWAHSCSRRILLCVGIFIFIYFTNCWCGE